MVILRLPPYPLSVTYTVPDDNADYILVIEDVAEQTEVEEFITSNANSQLTYSLNGDGTKNVINENIGSIILSTGEVTIFSLGISDNSFHLSLDLIPISNDIVSKRNQIVKIDVGRCNILGYVDEIAVGGAGRSINYQAFKRDR